MRVVVIALVVALTLMPIVDAVDARVRVARDWSSHRPARAPAA